MPYAQMIEERLRFLDINQNDISELHNARNILEPAMDEMLDRFYSHILGEPDLRALFKDKNSISHARAAQKEHWLNSLFSGNYDQAYLEKAVQIGRAHARIGLTLNWYIGAYCQMLDQFSDLITRKYSETNQSAEQIIRAVNKAIFLDMDLAIHCYLDAKDDTMRNIMRRATDFTDDVVALIDDLNVTAIQMTTAANTMIAEAAANNVAIGDAHELTAQAKQLNTQTGILGARLRQLQSKDKLYIVNDTDTSESGLIARLIAIFKQ
jgi:hypothetical protein